MYHLGEMIMQMIYRLRLAAKKVKGDRDFQAQMKEEPARLLFPIPGILSTLKEEKKKQEELNPEDTIVSIVENSVLEMREEEEKEKEKEKEKDKQKAEEIRNSEKEELSTQPSEVTSSTVPPVDLSEEWW